MRTANNVLQREREHTLYSGCQNHKPLASSHLEFASRKFGIAPRSVYHPHAKYSLVQANWAEQKNPSEKHLLHFFIFFAYTKIRKILFIRYWRIFIFQM